MGAASASSQRSFFTGRLRVSEVVARLAAGEPLSRISRDAGVSRTRIYVIGRRHGVNARCQQFLQCAAPIEDVEAVLDVMSGTRPKRLLRALLVGRGHKSAAQLAREFGMKRVAVLGVWRDAKLAQARLSQ